MLRESRPVGTVVPESRRWPTVALRSIAFDGQTLVVDLQGPGFSAVRATFQHVNGFRVLEELHLGKYWPEFSTPAGWLFEISSGGWVEEASVSGLISEMTGGREYFLTDRKCISVICGRPVVLENRGADPPLPE